MIWLIFAVLSVVGAAMLAAPVFLRRTGVVADSDATPAVLMDQLDEVRRDRERGLISGDEFAAAELEIKRRILSRTRATAARPAAKPGEGRMVLILAALAVPLVASGYYAVKGSPGISSIAFAERAAERQEAAQVAELTDRLYQRLISDPDGGPSEGWMLLGQTYLRMGRYAEAAVAFETVARRPEANSAVFSRLAEARINAEQGVVTPPAEAAVERALALDPGNPAASFFKAVSLEQAGDARAAYDLLIERLDQADGFQPWMQTLVAQANRIGAQIGEPPLSLASFAPAMSAPGPTAEDVAAAEEMSDADRGAFIRSMVDRLAARLEQEPGDLDGWMRLANAYTVLGEEAQAIEAYERAEALLADAPADDPRRQTVARALANLRG